MIDQSRHSWKEIYLSVLPSLWQSVDSQEIIVLQKICSELIERWHLSKSWNYCDIEVFWHVAVFYISLTMNWTQKFLFYANDVATCFDNRHHIRHSKKFKSSYFISYCCIPILEDSIILILNYRCYVTVGGFNQLMEKMTKY